MLPLTPIVLQTGKSEKMLHGQLDLAFPFYLCPIGLSSGSKEE